MAAPTVNWTLWSDSSSGTTMQNSVSINVSYTGDTIGMDPNPVFYNVPSSFTSAEVPNTPGSNGTILMVGGAATINGFHFDKPVVNPYMAMFSVGQGGVPVSFNFQDGLSFTLLSQGPGNWGGGLLTPSSGSSIVGYEGNGVIKFTGTFTDIRFTTPNGEYYYGATIGVSDIAAVPEPSSYAMLLAGLGLLGWAMRRRQAAPARARQWQQRQP
ncbi:PEPxxWA-CTERM sorting domain-containing protein [Rugamonas sp. CCM 8940]|nr:PEPxxWA-CTERM sorting domain-containing protein [Rugamonas sp. CCM 8940]